MEAKKVEKVLMKFRFGFADGATVGAHKIGVLPKGAVIVNSWYDMDTSVTSGGSATIALGYTGAATAFLSATAKATLVAASKGVKTDLTAVDGVIEADEFIVLGSDVEVLQTVGTAALTAGKGYLYIEYVVND